MTWREDYNKLLRSDYWQQVRRACKARAHGCCERCHTCVGPFAVHHTETAYQHLWDELNWLEYMRFWCRKCHQQHHGYSDGPQMTWKQLEDGIKNMGKRYYSSM
jgi:hypothetical protein